MSDRVTTGIDGLDEIFNGGVLRGSSVLVEGPPGSGKTTLGLQFIIHGITQCGESGVVITFEQFPEQLYRDAMAFGWDLKRMEEEGKLRVICTSPPVLERMLRSSDGAIEKVRDEIGAKRILVDSVTHLHRITENPVQLRELLHSLVNGLKLLGFTSLLTKEMTTLEPGYFDFEEYVVDTVIRLSHIILSGTRGSKRWLEVRKARGQSYIEGRHPYRITNSGICVFPCPHPKKRVLRKRAKMAGTHERVSSGVPGLDELLMGGYIRNTTALAAGPSGAGKTMLALHFLVDGAAKGERGLLLTFQESPERILQTMLTIDPASQSYIRRGLVRIEHILPMSMSAEEVINQLMRWCDKLRIKRLVIDSLSDLLSSVEDEVTARDLAYSLVKLLEERGITTIVTYELTQVAGITSISEIGYSFIADSIVYIGFTEVESEVAKVISVLKLRGGQHQPDLRQLLVTDRGLKVGTKFTGLSGVLQGAPIGHYRETVDEILQPLTFISDFIDVLSEEKLGEDERGQIIASMKEQVARVMRLLCEKYQVDYESLVGNLS
ncbi:MAG: ATPase domain-containing protein [Armatimonadota bacterium]|nr:AAA family ATPase [Armatimonadota bacterium]MCX7778082.1 AAA family ATPase [Armatimonadota bacterium]MDW8025469.1 ATPase domain-containing protein [Armatimonadota bacterium]